MRTTVAVIISVALCGVAHPGIITVKDDATGDAPTIQAAIDDANNGDMIVLLPGTYTGDGNRDIDFKGKAITVQSTDPDDRDIVSATVIDCNGTAGDPHRGFNFISGEDANSILSGLTITGGYAPDFARLTITVKAGGGILCENSSPVIRNCIITGNGADDGGGIYVHNWESDPVIEYCRITDNLAGIGGGICVYAAGVSITACNIENNRASDDGGLSGGGVQIIVAHEKKVRIDNCRIVANSTAGSGGGVNCYKSWDVTVSNCVVSGNTADQDGGGFYNFHFANSITITGCTVTGNRASDGGALYYVLGNRHNEISDSIIWANDEPELGSHLENSKTSSGYVDVSHSCIRLLDGHRGWTWSNNIEADPCFADPGLWDPNGTAEDTSDDFWVDGDYHLKSQGGHFDADTASWAIDDVTSPCIDAGDPAAPIGPEPFPNGGRRNMGAYGATDQASKSYFGGPPCETIIAGDINGDCKVDFDDFRFISFNWLRDSSVSDP